MTDAGGAAGIVSRGELNTLSHLIGRGGGAGRVGGAVSLGPAANAGLRHPGSAPTPTAGLADPAAPVPPTVNGKSVSRQ